MTEFENIVIGKSAVPSLIATIILMFMIPIAFFIPWRKKYKQQTKISWLVAGAAGFIISARVLELGVHYLCILADNPVSHFINGNTVAYVLYGITMAGVFEECGRYIILKNIMKKNRSPENAVLYGIGHGGIEILVVILPAMVTYLAVAVLFSAGNIDNALSTLKITEETAAAALPSVQAAAVFDFGTAALSVLERIITMAAHVGLTVIVYYSVCKEKKRCLPMAVILHMLIDTFAALYQRGAVPLWTVEAWTALWTAIIAYIAIKFYGKIKSSSSAENV